MNRTSVLLSCGLGCLFGLGLLVMVGWLGGCAARPHVWTDADMPKLAHALHEEGAI